MQWDLETDVVVVGSGGGAFTAAILARDHDARVAILERTDKVGGT
ncbi:MAG: FAD-dependent oxidoreductase, partial [Desulfobacterales bacterium]|nr:FAD-dependent oxidoreductase [Desulfobacterales bacterium]